MATIQGVYVALFGRPADPTGLAFFNGVTKNGADLNGIGDLASTQEYKDRFKDQTNTQIVNSIYQSLFGRDAEAAGLNFFVDALNKGTLNVKNIAIAILDGAQGNDKTISANKVAAADLYTKALDTATEIGSYQGNTAAAQGRAFLTAVTTTVPTAASVDASVATMASAGAAGNTVVLAAGVDSTVNLTTKTNADNTTTDKNDTITDGANWTAADKIDGGLGTDKLTASIAADVAVATDGLKNVEQVFITATAAATVDVTNAKELTQAWNDSSTKALTFDKVAATTTVGLKGTIAETTTFTYADTAGTNTANLSLDAAAVTTGKAVTIAGTEIVNISNTGASTVDTLTLDAGQTINVSGTGTLTLGVAAATLETVSATGFSGALTIDLTNNAAIKTVTGGTGGDKITIDGAHTNDITINGGDGADTLTYSGAGAETKALILTGGAGADQFVIATAAGNVQAVDTNANMIKTLVTISDFDKASDALKFSGLASTARDTILTAEQSDISSGTDLLAAATKAASYTSVNNLATFQYGADTYVLVQNGNAALDAGDTLIKVTGINVADLTASNFQMTA